MRCNREDVFATAVRIYAKRHATLVAYLKSKVDQADWHGVSDAANDLRVLEAAHLSIITP